ncbi:hypothetical protein BGZ65_008299 [Modicella reniformis]|uniref:Uncharacterized protein n=1 Tax=Modicella reniformis TaxID=1440133 RepID=A0A9P6SP13_9FUNG|nr:hypothetical protein BGZ65_008299 [Modicella reniformis]
MSELDNENSEQNIDMDDTTSDQGVKNNDERGVETKQTRNLELTGNAPVVSPTQQQVINLIVDTTDPKCITFPYK